MKKGGRKGAKRGAKRPTRKPSAKPSARARTRVPVPQPHGGALIPGAGGGPQPGSGRPSNEFRRKLFEIANTRTGFLAEVIDGAATVRTEVPLHRLLPFVVCANCGESQIAPKEPGNAALVVIPGFTSASTKDRIAAYDRAAHYSVGPARAIPREDVEACVRETLEIVARYVTPEQLPALLRELKPVWMPKGAAA